MKTSIVESVAIERLLTYGERKQEPNGAWGTLFQFKGGAFFFLADSAFKVDKPDDDNRHHEAKADRMGISADYVIWSNEHRGWWAPHEHGYVRSLTEAGRYSQARAMAIAGSQWAMPFEGIPNEIAMRLDDALEQVRGPNR